MQFDYGKRHNIFRLYFSAVLSTVIGYGYPAYCNRGLRAELTGIYLRVLLNLWTTPKISY